MYFLPIITLLGRHQVQVRGQESKSWSDILKLEAMNIKFYTYRIWLRLPVLV